MPDEADKHNNGVLSIIMQPLHGHIRCVLGKKEKMGLILGFPLASATAMCVLIIIMVVRTASGDPTDGFTEVQLSPEDFTIDWPYDLPLKDRYSFVDGVHKMWVLATDKPFTPSSPTRSRTEIRIRNHDYSSGVWQFEGHACVPCGTTGVSILQDFGTADPHRSNTTLQLRIYDGQIWFYNFTPLVSDVYNRWLRINLIHDVGAKAVDVFIDGEKVFQAEDKGGSHFFKFGVYTQFNSSQYMESNWRGVRIFKK